MPARAYAIDKQQVPESSEAMEGKNFKDKILLRERECEDPKIFFKFPPIFSKFIYIFF